MHRLAVPVARKQPAFCHRRPGVVTRGAHLPPLAQQIERLRRQHDIAVLAAFRLLDPDDLLRTIDMLDLQPDHLTGAQAAAIAETEQRADLEVAGDGQQPPRLVRAHHQRYLLRLTDVIDLVGQIQSPQGHAEQEPQPGHDAIAIADAHTGLGQVQLEAPDILSRRRVGGAVEKHSKPLAAVNVAPLRAGTEFAPVHVLDHAVTQRGGSIRAHRKLLSWMRLMTPRSSRQDAPAAIGDLYPARRARRLARASPDYRAAI